MKFSISYYLLGIILFLSCVGRIYAGEIVPSYSVIKTSLDKKLKKGEALFVFTCSGSGSIKEKKSIRFSYNGKNEIVSPDTNGKIVLLVKPGKYRFRFYVNTQFEEIETDSILAQEQYRTEVALYFTKTEEMRPMKKPVIYFYPEKEMNVNVQLDVKGELGFTYPAYNKSWEFTASPNGDLNFESKTYPYLFWEGTAQLKTRSMNLEQGFIVSNDSIVSFFENKLKLMGLTSKESADFITFWCPQMKEHKQCYVHFLFTEEMEKYASLKIEPRPDNLFRVFMLWTPTDKNSKPHKLSEQTLPSAKRNGFTVIEWGGTQCDASIYN